MSHSASANADAIAIYSAVLSQWLYTTPQPGWGMRDSTGTTWIYSTSGWAAQSNGSAVTLPAWVSSHPDTPPAVANAWDDEFAGGSIDAAWTWLNQGAATAALVSGNLLLTAPVLGTPSLRILAKPKPSTGAWSVTAAVSLLPIAGGTVAGNKAGIALRNSTTGAMVGIYFLTQNKVEVSRITNPTTITLNAFDVYYLLNSKGYLRISSDGGTNISFSVSYDGIVWDMVYTESVAVFLGSLDQVCLLADSCGASIGRGLFGWIRRTS